MKLAQIGRTLVATTLLVSTGAFAQGAPDNAELQPRARAMKMAQSMDKNKDGMVSKAELMAMVEQKWNEMDKGKKGMLSPDDVARIMLFLSGMGTAP